MKNKTAYFGVFTSLALILSYVETLIPISFGIPGIKLGLANLVIVIVLYTYVRIFVWESEYDSLQYGRGRFQSRHHGVAS